MTPEQQGRFCGSCQKTVVDFSSMSEREIIQFFERYTGNKSEICGRLHYGQEKWLYAAQSAPVQAATPALRSLGKWAAAAALVLSTLSQPLLAQTTAGCSPTPVAKSLAVFSKATSADEQRTSPPNTPNTQGLSGVVAYKEDPETKIAGATMFLRLDDQIIASTETQPDGSYFLALPSKDNIKGYSSKATFELTIQHHSARVETFSISAKRLYSGKSMSFLLRRAPMSRPKYNGGISIEDHRRMNGGQ